MSSGIGRCECTFRERLEINDVSRTRKCNTKMVECNWAGHGGWCDYRCPYCGCTITGLTKMGETHYCHNNICTVCGKIKY